MSTKKKTTNSTLSGSLDKLLKKYSNTQVATKFEQNIASIPYRDYETKEVEIFELFNIELFDITNTFITQLPSFIFIDDNKAKVFSGIEQYIKAKEEQTTFKGCLISIFFSSLFKPFNARTIVGLIEKFFISFFISSGIDNKQHLKAA